MTDTYQQSLVSKAYNATGEVVRSTVSCAGAPVLNATVFNLFDSVSTAVHAGDKAGDWAEHITRSPLGVEDVVHVAAWLPTAAVTGVAMAVKNAVLTVPAAVDFAVVKPLQGNTAACASFNSSGDVWKLPKLFKMSE